jgi:hypothetical protein
MDLLSMNEALIVGAFVVLGLLVAVAIEAVRRKRKGPDNGG